MLNIPSTSHQASKYSKYFHIHETFTKYTHHAVVLILINCNAFELHVLSWESQMGHGHPLIRLQPVQNQEKGLEIVKKILFRKCHLYCFSWCHILVQFLPTLDKTVSMLHFAWPRDSRGRFDGSRWWCWLPYRSKWHILWAEKGRLFWLVVEPTHLKNIRQIIGSFPKSS